MGLNLADKVTLDAPFSCSTPYYSEKLPVKLDKDFLATMREATTLVRTAGPTAATEFIQHALAGFASSVPRSPPATDATNSTLPLALPRPRFAEYIAPQPPVLDAEIVTANDDEKRGEFINKSYTNSAGTRAYKLYCPSGCDRAKSSRAAPLIVMLHGCKQNPDDFAAGTRMNTFAEQHNFFVAYPAQNNAANISNCWNWFQPTDQQRDRGEPSMIADITREIIRDYPIDAGRIYVAGLSAGGAMAAIMGDTYPDLFAGVGIHSGLPSGAARDVGSAFIAMKSGATKTGTGHATPRNKHLPAIIFHGDRDTTVHLRNAEQALAQFAAMESHGLATATVEKGCVPGGHGYTKTIQRDGHANALTELWIVHRAGHAWSGGSAEGSYTDSRGPDATSAMVDFFLSQPTSK